MRKVILIKFVRGRKGDVIGLTNDRKIALISKKYTGKKPQIGEVWAVEVIRDGGKYYIVKPIGKVRHAYLFRYACGHEELHETKDNVRGELQIIDGKPYIVEIIDKPYACKKCKEKIENELRRKLKGILEHGLNLKGEINPDMEMVLTTLPDGTNVYIFRDRIELSKYMVSVSSEIPPEKALQLVSSLKNKRDILPRIAKMWGIIVYPPEVKRLLEKIQKAKPIKIEYHDYATGTVSYRPNTGRKGIKIKVTEFVGKTVILRKDIEEFDRKYRIVWFGKAFEYRLKDTSEGKQYVLEVEDVNEALKLARTLSKVRNLYYVKFTNGKPLDWNDVIESEVIPVDMSRLRAIEKYAIVVPATTKVGERLSKIIALP